jgi:hypothetical protein
MKKMRIEKDDRGQGLFLHKNFFMQPEAPANRLIVNLR